MLFRSGSVVVEAMKAVQAELKSRQWHAVVEFDTDLGRAHLTVLRHEHLKT